jgi:hypothetical protein
MKGKNSGRFTPEPGTVDTATCGICGALMTVERDQFGPTGFAEAMAHKGHAFDFFECPHLAEAWHKQIDALQQEIEDTPSRKLADMMQSEVDEILRNHQATKTDFSSW